MMFVEASYLRVFVESSLRCHYRHANVVFPNVAYLM